VQKYYVCNSQFLQAVAGNRKTSADNLL